MIKLQLLIYFVLLNSVFALPKFAVESGTSCVTCHVNPTGGSLRNNHGTTIYSMENLPIEKLTKYTLEDWDGFVNDYIQLGGDFRVQGFSYTDEEKQKSAIFPMQADVYANIEINEKANIYYKVGLGPFPRQEFWTMFTILPCDGWMKLGNSLPNYGFKLDDHTSFIRGGNLNRTHTDHKEGMPFDPYGDLPGMIELGFSPLANLDITCSIANSFINSGSSLYDDIGNKNFTTKLSYSGTLFDKFNIYLSPSYMKESDLELMGISGGFSFGKLIISGEFDQAKNWPDTQTASAAYGEAVYKVKQGIHLSGKYDFFDPDANLSSGSISRYSVGLDLYPLNILEVKLQTRFTQVDSSEPTVQPEPEYLIQFHTWF